MLSTKAQKLVTDSRGKLERELTANPRARGILTDAAVKLIESRHLSEKARALIIKSAVDTHLGKRVKP